MALGDGQTLHGRKLMRTGRISYLQRADVLVAADNLYIQEEIGERFI